MTTKLIEDDGAVIFAAALPPSPPPIVAVFEAAEQKQPPSNAEFEKKHPRDARGRFSWSGTASTITPADQGKGRPVSAPALAATNALIRIMNRFGIKPGDFKISQMTLPEISQELGQKKFALNEVPTAFSRPGEIVISEETAKQLESARRHMGRWRRGGPQPTFAEKDALRTVTHEIIHQISTAREYRAAVQSGDARRYNEGSGTDEGITEAVTLDVLDTWGRAKWGTRFPYQDPGVFVWQESSSDPNAPPSYKDRTVEIRRLSAKATGRSWTSVQARNWRKALMSSDYEKRKQVIARVNAMPNRKKRKANLAEVSVKGYVRDGVPVKGYVRKLSLPDIPDEVSSAYDIRRLEGSYEFDFIPDESGSEISAIGRPKYGAAESVMMSNGFREKQWWIDPTIAEVKEVEGRIGPFERAVPKDGSGYSLDFPLQRDSELMYRGISSEEMRSIMATGQIRSNGSYNIGEGQNGMTLYAADPDTARSYASSFAPPQAKPTLGRPAYVIAVRRPGDEVEDPRLDGEIPYPREISADEIESIIEIRPGAVDPPRATFYKQPNGEFGQGSGISPSTDDFYKIVPKRADEIGLSWDEKLHPRGPGGKFAKKLIPDVAEADYRGWHTAPTVDYGASLDRMGEMVGNGSDLYTHPEWYFTGDTRSDWESFSVLSRAKGRPGKIVRIIRAVPEGVNQINSGDWVTLSRNYAKQHAASQSEASGQKWHTISKLVPAHEVWWNGDSINEFGWVEGAKSGMTVMSEDDGAVMMLRAAEVTDLGNVVTFGEVTFPKFPRKITRKMLARIVSDADDATLAFLAAEMEEAGSTERLDIVNMERNRRLLNQMFFGEDRLDLSLPFAAKWDEKLHPRGKGGKFGRKFQVPDANAPEPKKNKDGSSAPRPTKEINVEFREATDADRKSLKIPPAWTDVYVTDHPESPLRATGKDRKGRTQRRYSTEFLEANQAAKFERLRQFDGAREKVLDRTVEDGSDNAMVVRLIALTGIRPGSERNTLAEKKAYGATTLQAEHVKIDGTKVTLDFVGKEGIDNHFEVDDEHLAGWFKERLKSVNEGEQVFHGASDRSARSWLADNGGDGFLLKDFRTWKATAEALRMVKESSPPPPVDEKDFQQRRKMIGTEVSRMLNNTPQMALSNYISPAVFDQWRT